MKLICIEEHVVDRAISHAAQPAVDLEAPYMAALGSADLAPRSPRRDRPSFVEMSKAIELGIDMGHGRISAMDAHGIDMQVLSYSSPAQLVPEAQAVSLIEKANDSLATAIAAHPTRFSGFAALPWQTPYAAVDELDRAVTELDLKGVLIAGRPGDTFLDDSRYEPILEKLSHLGVPLYLHPFSPLQGVQRLYYGDLKPEVSAQFSLTGWGWHHEAGVHLLRLILSGVFERFPGLQVISGHWGEMVPFYLQRLDDSLPPGVTGLSDTISETYRRHVWVTPSGIFSQPHFEFIRDVVGLDRLIWSVDYPYVTLDGSRTFIEDLPMTDAQAHQVFHGNAEDLLGLSISRAADPRRPHIDQGAP